MIGCKRDDSESEVFSILNNEQGLVEDLRKANLIYGEISQRISSEKGNAVDVKNQVESLIQIIDQVKEMEDQIMDYLKAQKVVQERTRSEMVEKYKKALEERSGEKKSKEEKLSEMMCKIKDKEKELNTMNVMIKDVSKDNDSNLKLIQSWDERRVQWESVVEEQERRVKQLTDLSEYLSVRFKDLSEEYDQILQEKKGLMASKDNLEVLVGKSKKEAEEKIRELSIIDSEVRSELEAKVKESGEVSAEIAILKERNESYESETAVLREEKARLESEIVSRMDEVRISKEELLRMSDTLDQRRLETAKFMQELVENRRYLEEIDKLNTSLENKRDRLNQIDKMCDSSHNYDRLVELEHISEANGLLEQEISSLSSKIDHDESFLVEEISRLKESKVNISVAEIEQSLAELECEVLEAKSGKSSIVESFVMCEADTEEIANQITKISQLLSGEEGNGCEQQGRVSARGRKGRLKRSKAINTQEMEQVLIQSLRLIQRIDQSRVESVSGTSECRETDQMPFAAVGKEEGESAGNPATKSLESPKSGVSGFGKRVMISSRRLLTPRKGLFAPIPQYNRHRGSRCGDDDTLFGSDL
ncbi:hypothetical protein OJ253_3214 [Cryptosporidium canis]|uniref:Uncharacterized protein n=1 Tax=Cryptosporidium canis TaxID=195482 RepID=A0A9D5DJ37_9CRYT|nr:hypothetical protein OJ253_3214 [Cryptosporidium canis]